MDITQHLATTLKALRQARGWSLSTLWKIATGLNVPFSAFITPESEPQAVFDPQQQAMVVKPLFPWDEQLKFDHFSITLSPGALSESTPHEAGVIEHVVVISGELDMHIDGVWRTVYADSGVRFAGRTRTATAAPGRYIFTL